MPQATAIEAEEAGRLRRLPRVLRHYAGDFERATADGREYLPDSDLAPSLRAAAREIERLRRAAA